MAISNKVCRIFSLLLSGVLLASCGSEPKDISHIGEIDGQKIYQKYCTVCHGSKGDLGVSDAADLTVSVKTRDEKIYIVTNGSESGKMTSYKGILAEREVEAIVDYIETLKK